MSGILTVGGTMLGTTRDKPHRMMIDGQVRDMTDAAVVNYRKHGLDALVCLGGGGTAKNAIRLSKAGLNVITLPKTIDNDVAMTDATIGFATALEISTEAIDRLHSTAYSHHRIIVAELMGHRVGWLTLGAGLAGGADVILVPEIPYEVDSIVAAIRARVKRGLSFSIVAVAEGARTADEQRAYMAADAREDAASNAQEKAVAEAELQRLDAAHDEHTLQLARQLEELTGLESRVTILGYVTRGGTPSPVDRLLATRLGTAGADLISEGRFGVMVAARGDDTAPVPLDQVAGRGNAVPVDHSWVRAARHVGTCLGD
jgi:6-phosphofructokinase 1